ncbi:Dynlt1 [Symbiodinium sp. KB8]|nr:Dynlt1 [Symbiodinium sp. KB8]
MAVEFADTDAEFPDEEVNNHVRSALASVLNDATLYSDEKVEDWTHQIIEGTLKGLREINRPFKYIVTMTIMQKTGAGLHTASAAVWDKRDNFRRVPWENADMRVMVIVYGLALSPTPPDAI